MVPEDEEITEPAALIKDLIYHGKLVEAPSKLTPRRRKPHVDDNQSVGTISTSYSKAYSTFSAPNFDFHMHSPSATTPTTSRHQSPTRLTSAPNLAMELGLVGIGEHVKSLPSGKFTANLPILSRDPHLPESQFSRDGVSTPTGTNAADMTPISSPESDSDSDICRSDLDLERAANIALSRCFGVCLNRLSRPVRVIEAFSKFKDQCAEILREEESFSTIDWDDDGFSCYDVEVGDASNGSSGYDETSNRAQQSESRTKKRPAEEEGGDDDHDDIDQNPDQDQGPTRRGRSKRRRIGCREDYSCPFRKRNPCRFNARDFDPCANKSYKDMAELKRHISAEHGNQSCTYCGQPRRGEDHPPEDCLHNRQSNPNPDPKDPEDGVDNRKDKVLRSRTAGCKIQTWRQLWNLLFPDDEEVPCQSFDPVIEHHDIAVKGCKKFVLKTAKDIMDFVHQSPSLSVQVLQEIIHKRTKDLLQGSKYADYERYNMEESSDSVQIPTPTKGKFVVPVMHDQVYSVLDDGESPVIIATPQPSPQGVDTIPNSTSTGSKFSSSIIRERPIAPKMEQGPPPNDSQKACLAPGAFLQNGSPIHVSSGDHQAPSLLDLDAGNILNWSDMDLKNLGGYFWDDFVNMGDVTAEDPWMSCVKPDPGPSFRPFGGPGNDT
ncbi:hypothetical protein BDP81DRAFT_437231 [Colletotrichum phormii]|uniref:C2H2-type domain-containing protein n=1 Tax=Colletotrichum phormii TaxID=359342 RepID=A0AAI9ZHH8_9PEZI|nr:uncharacterized protein BDP81DRAFT_437231 [Colletotrichum phormii]KAK1624698.1 hypothetical protein BDP81DRAFT_437231 [Colletotrichum phormii]